MRKGVVLKIKKDRATIMADDCTFCEIRSFNGMYPGMEVCFNEGDILKKRITLRSNKYVNAACFMIIVLSSYLFLSFYQENIAAYAYVGIDINPSIELVLNRKGRIINARGLDEEGKEVLQEIDVRKMESVDGVKAIITKTIEMNYIEEDNTNEITIYAVTDEKNSEDGNKIVEKVEKAVKEEVVARSLRGEIKTFVSNKKVKSEADKKGISVAKYIAEDAKETVVREIGKKDKKDNKEFKVLEDSKDKDNKWKKDKEDKKDNKDIKGNKYDKVDKINTRDIRDKDDNRNNKDKVKESNVKGNKESKDKKDKDDDKKDKDDDDDKENKKKDDRDKKDKDVKNDKKEKSSNSNKGKDDKNEKEDKTDNKNKEKDNKNNLKDKNKN